MLLSVNGLRLPTVENYTLDNIWFCLTSRKQDDRRWMDPIQNLFFALTCSVGWTVVDVGSLGVLYDRSVEDPYIRHTADRHSTSMC